jgi:hypothetical protein
VRYFLLFISLLLGAIPAAAVAPLSGNSPKAVISYLRDAYDADSWDGAIKVWWPDGYVIQDSDGKPPKERISFRDQGMSGLGVQYITTLKFLKIRIAGNRAVVRTYERSKRMYLSAQGGYEYVGAYSDLTVEYVCENRGGQWRILSREILKSRSYGSDVEWRRRDDAKLKASQKAHQ